MSQTTVLDVFAQHAAEVAENAPARIARLDHGCQVIEESLPDGRTYDTLQLGERELTLFEAARGSVMSIETISNGALSWDVLTARCFKTGWISNRATGVGGQKIGLGQQQYMMGKDNLDHLCVVLPASGGKSNVVEIIAKGYMTPHNPELVDKRTGFIKSDYNGGTYNTVARRMLLSRCAAFDGVKAQNSYERGFWNCGLSVQFGGWRVIKSQLRDWFQSAAKNMPAAIDGVTFEEFLGFMGQRALNPNVWVVEHVDGYQQKPLEQLKLNRNFPTPFVDPRRCLAAWPIIAAEKNVALYMKFVS